MGLKGFLAAMWTKYLVFFVFIFAGSAQALEIRATEGEGISFVDLSGDIVPNDAGRVVATLVRLAERHKSENRLILIRLNSPGGLIGEALQISELISKAKVPVAVTEKDTCASACFLIFMKSPLKLVKHGARVGVHAASDGSGNETAKTTLTTVEMARLFKDSGVPNSVIGKMVTAPPGEMHYLSDSELTQMGARFMDDDNFVQATNGATPPPPSPSPPPSQQPPASISATVTSNPAPSQLTQPPQPTAEEQAEARRREEFRAEQDRNFSKYWNQILGWSKAQHSGAVAFERRCNQTGCAKVVAYFDRQQRYVEAWNYDLPPKGSGVKLVCRQTQVDNKLACADWYDGHEFVVDYTHQIGADRVTSGGDLLDIFR
jgi:hypothetical protein